MAISRGERPPFPKPRQIGARHQLVAAVIGVLPLYSGTIAMQLRGDRSISTGGFIVYLGVVSPLAIVLTLLLLRFLCRERPRDLNLRPGTLSSDLLASLVLVPVILVSNATSTSVLSGLVSEPSTNPSVRLLFENVAADPGLLLLFVGLLLPLGAASEEVIRVFLLSRLWAVWPSHRGRVIAVVISAGLFGLIHLYQGPVHVVWAGIFGLIMAAYYLWSGRVLPLMLAHYVTNAVQLLVFAVRALEGTG